MLCNKLSQLPELNVMASLALGPIHSDYPVPHRAGGFGGVSGLLSYLEQNSIDTLIDATHPFATQMKQNAMEAARISRVEFIALQRELWSPAPQDLWNSSPTLSEASRLVPNDSTVFAALGSKNFTAELQTLRHSLYSSRVFLRTMSPLSFTLPPNWEAVEYHPPLSIESELSLLERHKITCLLCRNSGGQSGRFKLTAAAMLGLQVYMVTPSQINYDEQAVTCYSTVDELLNNERFQV